MPVSCTTIGVPLDAPDPELEAPDCTDGGNDVERLTVVVGGLWVFNPALVIETTTPDPLLRETCPTPKDDKTEGKVVVNFWLAELVPMLVTITVAGLALLTDAAELPTDPTTEKDIEEITVVNDEPLASTPEVVM